MVDVGQRSQDSIFRVLLVDDEELYCQAICDELARQEITSDMAYTAAEALARVESAVYQAILLDHRLPDADGIQIIPRLLARQPDATVVMMTAYHTIPNAVQAIRLGAEDYIVKEPSIKPIVDRVLEIRRRVEARIAADGWHEHLREGLAGRSAGIAQVVKQLEKIAKSPDTTLLLSGETGVGKEVAARYLHNISRPDGSPFIAVDCAALPGNLTESILFGHEKGAFTGADQTRAGACEEAGDGTLLLDEIGDMGQMQSKLLRLLESRSFHRVGSMREIPLRARVVAATNQDLQSKVEQGSFREDLYQRLCVFPIHIPPLRERGDDILLLANHFIEFFCGKLNKEIKPLDEEVEQHLLNYSYPGNVRELKNIIERAVIMTETGRIELRHLPRRVLAGQTQDAPLGSSVPLDFRPGIDTLEDLEKRMISHALRQAKNVKSEAARLLGISRFQLMRRMERHGIGKKDSSD